jgi:cell division protein FtsQ
VGLTLVALAAGAYAGARVTSVFAVEAIEVTRASPRVEREVRAALAPVRGRSLVALDGTALADRVAKLPWVASMTYDRAFPNTLRVEVTQERPLAVLRRGADAWLVAASGRILQPVERRAHPRLPRIWLAASAAPRAGSSIGGDAARAVAALAPVAGTSFLRRVRFVRQGDETLTLVLRSGLELRLGDASDLRLKLEIARRLLLSLTPPGYLDLSVPERPVAATNPQVEGLG